MERGGDMFPMKYWTDTFAREEIMREKSERRFRFIKKNLDKLKMRGEFHEFELDAKCTDKKY